MPISNPSDPSSYNVPCFETVKVDCLPAGYADSAHIQVPLNATWINFPCDSLPTDLTLECLYSFEYWSYETMWDFFEANLVGNLTSYGGPLDLDGPIALQALYDYGNITFETINERFNGVADAMTSRIRQSNVSWQITSNSSEFNDSFFS
jgi:hypothetical protein